MFNVYFFVTTSLIFISINIFAESRIYLIRHAAVQIENPGWCYAKRANAYKEEYDTANICAFEPEKVLNKIKHPEKIDTIFCSPQFRAIQTAELLFKKQVIIRVDNNLMELDYPVIRFPIIKLPLKAWLFISRISWITGLCIKEKPSLQNRKINLEKFSDELISYAEKHGQCVVVAHGMVNKLLIQILKKKGWKLEHKDGLGNLSVNCFKKKTYN